MNKMLIAALALIGGSLAMSNRAEAVDRFAFVQIYNTTDIVLTFQYRFGNGNWQNAMVRPGETFYLWSEFTAPGSYVYQPIALRYDEDLRPGYDFWQEFLPGVGYSPDANYANGYLYYFGYDGNLRQFVHMFPS